MKLDHNTRVQWHSPTENEFEEVEDDIYKARKKMIRNWIIAIICVTFFLYFVLSDFHSGLTQSRAQACVEHYLKTRYLYDPDSYKSESWSNFTFNERKNTYSIVHTYRARNVFGGYIRKTQFFELDEKGNIISRHAL